MRICVAGQGAFGQKHLDALKRIPDVEVVSLSTPNVFFADAKGQMTRGATHHHDKVPAAGGTRIFHEVLDQMKTDLARCLEAERRYLPRERQIVVYSLWDMTHPEASACALHQLACGEHRVTPAYGHEITDMERLQGRQNTTHLLGLFRWICP